MEELERHPPDVILSDHGLPNFDGFTALAIARERCPQTPFIFVTGAMGEEVAIDSLRSGASDYVLKTRISNLVPAVKRALRRAEQRKEPRLADTEEDIRRLNSELEQRLQERTVELQMAYQEMDAFSYSISHDLRAPLIHIAGFAEMLKSELGPKLDEKSRRHLQTIAQSAESMGRMITDLLTFTRIGRADLHKVRFKLSDTIQEVRRDLQAQTHERNVTWIMSDLPEVHADPFMLRQALYHLLANALKFTRCRDEARIEVTARDGGQEQIFSVRDNGVGFDMRHASRLFGVFQRLHSSADFEGTGIGLANVRRIIDRHGGRTWAEGDVNAGATFHFSLPVAEDAASR
jgi:light-regulated signal transduction histidine kinase (bacteriophytochrome)